MDSQDLAEMVTSMLAGDMKQEPDQGQGNLQLQNHQQLVPPRHLSCIPNLDQIQSGYDFDLLVPPDQNNNVVFSQSKLFIKMGSRMTINLSYREQSRNEQLFLRAMIIFSKPAEMHLPVKRCANHRVLNQQNAEPQMLSSILKINDPKAHYIGTEEGQTFQERLSVVIPIDNYNYDENGKIAQSVGLEFGCQNSCSSGINRRPTSIVFTLENQTYDLLGKSAIEFKVCSCPKRDSEREREPKRKMENNVPFPRGKRPKYNIPQKIVKPEPESESDSSNENAQNSVETVAAFATMSLTLTVPTEISKDVLKAAFNVIAGKMAEDNKQRPEIIPHYEKCLKDLKKLRRRFEH